MGLYMPTNITPDVLGPLGNGVVDPSEDLVVSWQVNGSSAMTAFKIDIYKNTAAAPLVYTTGKITSGCPFYGTDALGNKQRFSYTIEDITYSNAEQYKMYITEYWGAGGSSSVQQLSPSVFIKRNAPVLTLTNPAQITTRTYTFYAAYSQTQGDDITWVKWNLLRDFSEASDGTGWEVIEDTGKIYGTGVLQFSYDEFVSDGSYRLSCEIETQSGIRVEDSIDFSSAYTTTALHGSLVASSECGTSAIRLDADGTLSIYGEAEGDYEIENNILKLSAGSTITWDNVNQSPMEISEPWNILAKIKLQKESADLLSIEMGAGKSITFSYVAASRTFSLTGTGVTISYGGTAFYDDEMYLLITPNKCYVTLISMRGGLYPNASLYPKSDRYPKANGTLTTIQLNSNLSYAQDGITSIRVGGKADVYFAQEISGTLPQAVVSEVVAGTYTPEYYDNTNFLADFKNGLNAGTVYLGGYEITGWDFYRYDVDKDITRKVCETGVDVGKVYDYSIGSQNGTYIYYMYALGETKMLSTAVISNEVTKCFWDWVILECADSGSGFYELVREYKFGKNLNSGSMSNNNRPTIEANFTKYPTVMQSSQLYRSGTIESMIGDVSINENGGIEYSDNLELRDAIEALSISDNALFLKNRKGDVMRISIGGEIMFTTMDNAYNQALTVSLPWVETGDASDARIVKIVYR